MKEYTITIDFKVSKSIIDDGLDMEKQKERIKEYFEESFLPYAIAGIETKANVTVTRAK